MWRVSTLLAVNGLSTPHATLSEEILDRGTAVHAAVEDMGQGNVVRCTEAQAPYVRGAQEWFLKESPEVLEQERRWVSIALGITGRVDMIVRIEERVYVVDVKTGGRAPWHGIQLAGYKTLAEAPDAQIEEHGPRRSRYEHLRRAVLYLPGNGKHEWWEPKPSEQAQDEYLFLSALALTQWRRRHGYLDMVDPAWPEAA